MILTLHRSFLSGQSTPILSCVPEVGLLAGDPCMLARDSISKVF